MDKLSPKQVEISTCCNPRADTITTTIVVLDRDNNLWTKVNDDKWKEVSLEIETASEKAVERTIPVYKDKDMRSAFKLGVVSGVNPNATNPFPASSACFTPWLEGRAFYFS